ncbi:MAG: proton-conducting transporter membrane subunit [Thermoplasmata archaeon]
MDPFGLVLTFAIASFFAGAALAFLGRRVAYAATIVGATGLVVVAVRVILLGPVQGPMWTGPLGEMESFGLDGLSAFFALAAGLVWISTSVYSLYYDDGPSPLLALTYAVTLGSIAVLVSASSFLLFLMGWESMTLASFGMILQASGKSPRIFSAAFVFLAFGEASTLFVFLAVAGYRVAAGTFTIMPVAMAAPLATLVFVVGLIGFGLKMGVAPFHMSEWLPIAHSSAPSNASAVLSSTLTLAGAYGLFRLLSILPTPPVWWGAVTLSIGAVSALLGALFASVSEHTKGLPAYSTIENNGLILVAVGVALVARSEGLMTLYVFALFAAFYQALAHAVAKTALFLSAGYVEHSTHTFDLNVVQGRAKNAARGAVAGALIAPLSLAAAPPLAGFVSEWMILEALFQSFRFTPPAMQFVGLLAGAAVALAAGLVLVAMVKYIGFSTLWQPSRPGAADRPAGLGTVLAAMAVAIAGLGVGAPWVLRFLTPSVSAFAHVAVTAPVSGLLSIPFGWSIVSGSPFGILSPPAVPIFIGGGLLVALGYYALGVRTPVRRIASWMAGSPPGRVEETYTSFGYSTGVRIMFRSILRTREVRAHSGTFTRAAMETPVAYNVELEVLDPFKIFYDELVRFGMGVSTALKEGVMPGRVGRYLAYLLVATLVVVIYVAIAV